MESIKSRQLSVHTYHEETALKIHAAILDRYFSEFKKLSDKFTELENRELKNNEV